MTHTDESNVFRDKVWYIINTIQANQLFVHSSTLDVNYTVENMLSPEIKAPLARKNKTSKGKEVFKTAAPLQLVTKKLPKILTLAVLNALTPNSAELLVGGHGGGKTSLVKYLGRMFTGQSLSDIEECIVRAHPQLTEEKLIATLKVSKLMQGQEEVIWRTFAKSFWKLVDEVNRCSPYTQNILLSLLAEGKIKYYDAVLNVSKYCLYATLNPNDVGTFEMSGPFLDRFGISVPITMPQSQDLAVILESKDEKLGGYDELVQVPQVLTEEVLLNIWYDVESVPCSLDAENFIHAIIREYTMCVRLDKGNSDYLKPSNGLCNGCHFNVPDSVPCNNVDDILSVRVAKDLLRYSKALSWLLGLKEVSINIVITIAPYIISHRVNYLERVLNKTPYWGDKYAFTANIIDLIRKRYQTRKIAYEIIQNFREGHGDSSELDKLKLMAKNDLIVKLDLLPLANSLSTSKYQKEVKKIYQAVQTQDLKTLAEMRKTLLQDMDFPNRGELINILTDKMKEISLNNYNCAMELWDSIRITISGMIPQFSKKLLETTQQRGTYRLRTEDLELIINVTGIKSYDVVNFSFFGGASAIELKETLEERFKNSFKSMEQLLQESHDAQAKADEEFNLLTKDISFGDKSKDHQGINDKKSTEDEDLFDESLLNPID